MKKIVLAFIVIATINLSAGAQIRRHNNSSAPDSTQHDHFKRDYHKQLAEKLQLSDDQKQQLKSINADLKNRITALKGSNLSAEEFKAKRTELIKERKQKMMALLTPEQKEKLQQYRKSQASKGNAGAGKAIEKMKEKLALSDEQVSKLNEQKEAFKSKAAAIRNNQSLSIDDKKAQMKALKEERRNNFKNVLTPDQLKKLEDMRQKRAGKTA